MAKTLEASASPKPTLWHDQPTDSVISQLDASLDRGLASSEAERRLQHYGPNILPKGGGDTPFQVLWRQINDPLVWVLIGSAFVALAVDPQDGIKNGLVILSVVIINTLIGFVQEFKAGKAIQALDGMVPQTASVTRDGQKASIPTSDLVPGDIVHLASGDRTPADLRLVQVKNLQVDESALTGESTPVQKSPDAVGSEASLGDRTSLAFSGSLVTYGTATGVVVETGSGTELGKISTLLKEAVDLETPLTKALGVIGRQLTVAIIALALVMLAIGTGREVIQNGAEFLPALQGTVIFAIALAVGAIPEGLPAIVTIALAIGVQRMAKRRAIVRRLPSVETLGSTSVICSDKTGTLTRNEMTVQALWTPAGGEARVTGVGYEPRGDLLRDDIQKGQPLPLDVRRLLEAGSLCSDASLDYTGDRPALTGDPTEGALLVASEKAGLGVEDVRRAQPRVDAIPFESENQFMATLHLDPMGQRQIILKGAPEVVFNLCGLNDSELDSVHDTVDSWAQQGMRVLAFAEKPATPGQGSIGMEDAESGFTLVGLQGMIDPPRPEAIESISSCHACSNAVM